MEEMYGIDVDDSRISKMMNKLLQAIGKRHDRELESVYMRLILNTIIIQYAKKYSKKAA